MDRQIATDAYVYGYPLVTMEMTRRVMTNAETPKDNHAPMGRFFNSPTYLDVSFRDVTTPQRGHALLARLAGRLQGAVRPEHPG
jgi:hypothetical protein